MAKGFVDINEVLKEKVKQASNNNILSDALNELSKELKLLSGEKRRLEVVLDNAKRNVVQAQETEKLLRDRLQKLTSLETKLATEIIDKEHKLSEIKDKISKVRKAREELAEF